MKGLDWLLNEIAKLPSDNGWWHSHNQQAYEQLGRELVAAGVEPDKAAGVLERAYYAATDEHGA